MANLRDYNTKRRRSKKLKESFFVCTHSRNYYFFVVFVIFFQWKTSEKLLDEIKIAGEPRLCGGCGGTLVKTFDRLMASHKMDV